MSYNDLAKKEQAAKKEATGSPRKTQAPTAAPKTPPAKPASAKKP